MDEKFEPMPTLKGSWAIPAPTMPSEAELEAASLGWWAFAGPTYHDQWPEALRALSSPTIALALDRGEVEALIAPFDEGDDEAARARRAGLASRIDAATGGGRRLVKLNSRSPKDATDGEPPFATGGAEAVALLSGSIRVVEDLLMFSRLPADKGASLLLREDSLYLRESEVRVFVREGRVEAASVYHHRDPEVVAAWRRPIAVANGDDALGFVRGEVIPACHLATFVADVAFSERRDGWELVEVNPYGGSDPCAFGDYPTMRRWAALHGRPSVVAGLPEGGLEA